MVMPNSSIVIHGSLQSPRQHRGPPKPTTSNNAKISPISIQTRLPGTPPSMYNRPRSLLAHSRIFLRHSPLQDRTHEKPGEDQNTGATRYHLPRQLSTNHPPRGSQTPTSYRVCHRHLAQPEERQAPRLPDTTTDPRPPSLSRTTPRTCRPTGHPTRSQRHA
jgi:hypothetical protein